MTTGNDDKSKTTVIEGIAHRYVVIADLGAGSMGCTRKVFDFKSGPLREFAIKIMNRDLADRDPFAKKHFLHEARATMALRHPNVVMVHFIDELRDGTPLYAMELLNGKSVAQLIKDMGRIHPVVALNLTIDLLDGLHEAHRGQLIHQDVKPGNIMTHTERKHGLIAKAVDFGVCRTLDDCDGGFAGTFAYAAPEQARGKNIGPWTDIFGAGVTLFEMLTGQRPFLAYQSSLSGLLARADKRPPSILDFGHFERELADIVAAMLSPTPADRPGVKELTSRLGRIMSQLGPGPKIDKTSQVGPPILRSALEDATEPTVLASSELRQRQEGMPEPLPLGSSETLRMFPPIDPTLLSPTPRVKTAPLAPARVAPAAAPPAPIAPAPIVVHRGGHGVVDEAPPASLPRCVVQVPISQRATDPPSRTAEPPNVELVYVTDAPSEDRYAKVEELAELEAERAEPTQHLAGARDNAGDGSTAAVKRHASMSDLPSVIVMQDDAYAEQLARAQRRASRVAQTVPAQRRSPNAERQGNAPGEVRSGSTSDAHAKDNENAPTEPRRGQGSEAESDALSPPKASLFARLQLRLRRSRARIARLLRDKTVVSVILLSCVLLLVTLSFHVGNRFGSGRWFWQPPPPNTQNAAPNAVSQAATPQNAPPSASVTIATPTNAAPSVSAPSPSTRRAPAAPAPGPIVTPSAREPRPKAPKSPAPNPAPQHTDYGYVDFDGHMRSAPPPRQAAPAKSTPRPSSDARGYYPHIN